LLIEMRSNCVRTKRLIGESPSCAPGRPTGT
jgi:hypothetical protein